MGSPMKRANKSASKKQAPVASPLALNQSFGQDVQSGSQATDWREL